MAIKAVEEQRKSSAHLKHKSRHYFTYSVASTHAKVLHISSHHFNDLPKSFPFKKVASQFEGFKDGWNHRMRAAKVVMDAKDLKDDMETRMMHRKVPEFTSQKPYGQLEELVEGRNETFQGWRKEYKADSRKLSWIFNEEALNMANREIGQAALVDRAMIVAMGADVETMLGGNADPGRSNARGTGLDDGPFIRWPLTPATIASKPQTAMPGRRGTARKSDAYEGLNARSPWLKNADTSASMEPRNRTPAQPGLKSQYPRPEHDVVRCTISKGVHIAPVQRMGARPPTAPVHPMREGVRLFETPGGESRTTTGVRTLLVDEKFEPPPGSLVVDQDERDTSVEGLPRINTLVARRATATVSINETNVTRITPRPTSRAGRRRESMAQLKQELISLNADLRSKSVNWINREVKW